CCFFFFFSSRRRHTRFSRDWSSDVCSSDLDCKEFVNADNIAAGLSPFNVEGVAFEAGRLMLHRINELLDENADFAFETTLATRRSEERRVGKECRSGWWENNYRKEHYVVLD